MLHLLSHKTLSVIVQVGLAFALSVQPAQPAAALAKTSDAVHICALVIADKTDVLYQPRTKQSMGWFIQETQVEVIGSDGGNWRQVYGMGLDGAHHRNAHLSGWVRQNVIVKVQCEPSVTEK